MPETLQIGILIDRKALPAWQWQTVENLKAMDGVNVRLIGVAAKNPNWLERLAAAPFAWYAAFDQALFSRKPGTRNAMKQLAVTDDVSPWSEELSFDLLVNMTAQQNPGWLRQSRLGVWSVVHGDRERYAGLPAYFWEMHDSHPVSGSAVVMQTAAGAGEVIYRSYAKTHSYSLFLSRNPAYWKSTAFLPRCIEHVKRYGNPPEAFTTPTPKQGFPDAWQMAVFLGKIAARFLKEKWEKKRYRYQYQIGFRRKEKSFTAEHLGKLFRMKPPKSEFWADPFLIRHENSNYLFFENFPYDRERGIISYARLNEDGSFTPPETALERDYHLSYPFFIEDNGTLYMMPETSGNGTIELYRAVEFPRKWELAKVLMHGVNAQDATIIRHNGLYWLFVNLVVAGGAVNDELFVFYADSLLGEWKPHAKNPVVSDVSRARPAGNLFHQNGELIRPSQDCSKRYGYAINFNRVDVLNTEDYRETLLYKLRPDGFENYLGIHTYNANEDFEVIDMAGHIPAG